MKIINKQYFKLYQREYRKKYPWRETFQKIKQRCSNPNTKNYHRYGGRGIKCLITEEELEYLWFRDKAYDMKRPSIDRKDNDGNYELSNCRYIENVINSAKDNRKSILQYDLNNNFIREWDSAKEAGKILNIDRCQISDNLRERQKTCHGFIWRYK